jgi:hypothetical protein
MGRQRVTALIVALILVCVVAGCGEREQEVEQAEGVIAVVNGRPITIQEIQTRLDGLQPEARDELDNPGILSAFISSHINEVVWAEAAREAGIDQTDEYRRRMTILESTILAQMYGDWIRDELEQPDEGRVDEIFEREKDLYSTLEVSVRHILCSTEAVAQEALTSLRGGMAFEEAVTQYSEDSYTKDKGGDLGTISRETPIPGLGVAPDFFDALSKLETGQLAGPIRTRRGYHVVLVLNKSSVERMSPETLRAQIVRRLKKESSAAGVSDVQADLWKRFNVQVFDARVKEYIGYPVTPEQYVRHIQEATAPGDKIELCRQMVSQFPENKYAPWAHFMLGFVLSEELHSYADAESSFRTILQRHPDSDWAAAARWMIENMRGEHPRLRGLDDVKARARGAEGGSR